MYNEKETQMITLQRAALMGAFAAILTTEEEKTIEEIKVSICYFLSDLIKQGVTVGDKIELDITSRCIIFIEQQNAVATVNSIL
jgi:hypothetical protein